MRGLLQHCLPYSFFLQTRSGNAVLGAYQQDTHEHTSVPAVGLILQSHICNRLLALRLKIQAYTSSTYRLYTVVEDLDVWSV